VVIESAINVADPKAKETDKKTEVPRWKKAAKTLWKGAKAFWKAARAFVFVLTAFAFWYLFARLGEVVTGRCELASWWPPLTSCDAATPHWSDTVMLLATLALAIWAARRLVFPPDD
jgi:hypothetical protein